MKKIISYLIMILVIVLVFIYREDITNYVTNNIIKQEKIEDLKYNDYAKKKDYKFVSVSSDLKIHKKEDIKNIFYTVLDSGTDEYNIYCDTKYKNCTNDVEDFFNDKDTLSEINNFVHPYNSFKNIKISVTNYGKITLTITHIYNSNEISIVNEEIDKFIKENINDTMNNNEKIKVFHDFIVNNTKFDTEIENSSDRLNSTSYTAYGLIINHKAICGGYTDTMAIYLDKLNIPNIRISTTEHVWNLVNIDESWLNLDVTWDDPVTSNGTDMLMYDYYLIDTNTLLSKDTTQHNFNKDIYLEAK